MIGRPALLTLLLLLGGCGRRVPVAPARAVHPVRVMSLNQCTDQLVLALLPPSRIASVTWLSRDPRYSAMVAAAGQVGVNHGAIEDVVATRPDLIVTDTFSNPAGRALIERLGLPLTTVPDASDAAAIRANVRALAAALGEPARGAALVARMDRQLTPVTGPRLRVAAWGRDGTEEGPLMATVIRAAGLVDVTPHSGPVDLEGLLRAAPDFLVESGSDDGGVSLGDVRREHPLVRRRWPASRVLHVPARYMVCATPAIGEAADVLRAQVRAMGRGA